LVLLPVVRGLLKGAAQLGGDSPAGEGEGVGTPLTYGGPYLGVLACRKEYIRQMPGRLVGQTVDRNGKRCWALTFQTREQHIRRERATSNICTNQGLLALRAAVYLTALGPQGLKETAELCLRKAHYAADQLATIASAKPRFNRPFFKEFAVRLGSNVPTMLAKLRSAGYDAGLALGRWYPQFADSVVVAVTEKRTRTEMDGLAAAV